MEAWGGGGRGQGHKARICWGPRGAKGRQADVKAVYPRRALLCASCTADFALQLNRNVLVACYPPDQLYPHECSVQCGTGHTPPTTHQCQQSGTCLHGYVQYRCNLDARTVFSSWWIAHGCPHFLFSFRLVVLSSSCRGLISDGIMVTATEPCQRLGTAEGILVESHHLGAHHA
ncbi:hypothetical protein GQ53DRAFT_223529 [Thozetella sp. PMI_491]|nr:hypothetical protein GQ53DRAFT_223529 [Thozetella sp. PMI_491]